MHTHKEISTLSKEIGIPDHNLVGIIKILNRNEIVNITIDENEQTITATDEDISSLCLVAGDPALHQYGKLVSLIFMHIDQSTAMMGVSRKKLLGAMDNLAAAGLQDHYIDKSGNMTIIQFHSEKFVMKQRQRRQKRRKPRKPNRRKR